MIWLILLFGLGMRLVSLGQSLWLDEAISAQVVKNSSWWQLLVVFPRSDFHPPGYYLLLKLWSDLFGFSEVSLRMPSVLMSVIVILVVWLIGRDFFGKRIGLLAAWILAVNPLFLYYSQEARMYVMATLAVVVNFYFFWKWLTKSERWSFGFVVSLLFVLNTDYVAYLSFLGQFAILLGWYRNRVKDWAVQLIPGALMFAIWMQIFWAQLYNGVYLANQLPAWQKVVGGFELKSLVLTGVKFMIGRISWFDNWVYIMVVSVYGIIEGLAIYRALRYKWKMSAALVMMSSIPILSGWIISAFLPIYSYFRVLFGLPFLCFVMAIGISGWKKWGYVWVVLLSCISLAASGRYLTEKQFQREDWRGAVQFLQQSSAGDSVVVFESSGEFAPYTYYADERLRTISGLVNIPAMNTNDLVNLSDSLQNTNKVMLMEYLVDITDPKKLLQQQLRKIGFKEMGVYDFYGVGLIREYIR